MADFSNIDWVRVLAVIAQVQAEVEALKSAVTPEEKASAVGAVAVTVISAAEAFSGKDLVNDEAFKRLIEDVVRVVGDVGEVKPAAV